MKLYEISKSYEALLTAIENEEIPEEAVKDTLDAVQGEFEEKADNIACIIKSLKAEEAALKAEEAALKRRRTAKANAVERLTQYLFDNMETMGGGKIETARNVLSIRKNPQSLAIANEEKLIDWLVANKMASMVLFPDPAIDKKSLKDYIKAHEDVEIPYARLVQGTSLSIK